MPFALLLSLKLVFKLLLEFLFAKVHFTNGSVVFYPPLTSWEKKKAETSGFVNETRTLLLSLIHRYSYSRNNE